MGSQVDINSCSDACTHSKQVVEPQAGRLGHTHTVTHRGTQVSMKLCIGVEPDMASQVDINTCTDAYTHSKQGVGTEMRQLGHAHSDT